MTNTEKQLLLKDLCGRLLYGVICLFDGKTKFTLHELNPHEIATGYYGCGLIHDFGGRTYSVEDVKPYLRPMSSMTEEERDELYTAMDWYGEIDETGNVYTKGQEKVYRETFYEYTDWLNAHHLDYRRLIPMGLALEAPEDMYKTE